MTGNDGVYSRYLTDFDLGEGRYEITVFVDDNSGRAFSFQKERSKSPVVVSEAVARLLSWMFRLWERSDQLAGDC